MEKESMVLQQKTFFTPKRMARMAVLIAMSGVGAFVKIPTPTGDMGIDSAPGYFAGMVKNWDWKEAQIIGIFARLLAAAVVGFPLGLPIQILWGIFLGGCMGVHTRLTRLKFGVIPAVVVATLINGVYFSLICIPSSFIIAGNSTPAAAFGAGIAGIVGLCVASALASSIGAAAYGILSKTNIVKA